MKKGGFALMILALGIAAFISFSRVEPVSVHASEGMPGATSTPPAPLAVDVHCPLRVMPLGDSVTKGSHSLAGDGYRRRIQFRADYDGVNFVPVGRQKGGSFKGQILWHEGYSGYTINQVNSIVDAAIAANHPDVVVLMAGTADIAVGYPSPSTMAAQLQAVINKILAHPGVFLVVASIPPVDDSIRGAGKNAIADAYSAQVRSMVSNSGRTRYSEVNDILTLSDLADGLHPNDHGYTRIGDSIYPHLKYWAQTFCPATPTPTPSPTPTPTPVPVWRFRGNVYREVSQVQALGGTPEPIPGMTLELYGYNEGEEPPGELLQTRETDEGGFFNFYILPDYVRDTFHLVPIPPEGLVLADAEVEKGEVLEDGSIEWHDATPEVHLITLYFATPTPTPTATSTPTPTVTPTPTRTPTPTPSPYLYLPLVFQSS